MDANQQKGTITEVLSGLKELGYTMDCSLREDYLICDGQKVGPEDFEIEDVFRYGGSSDPREERAVYAIRTLSGKKGTLLTGFGIDPDDLSLEMLRKLNDFKRLHNE